MNITDLPDFPKRRTDRPMKPRGIILHWTAGTSGAKAAVDYTARDNSGGWYHYILDRNVGYRCLLPTQRGAHAGAPWNSHYIGIASAQPIYPGFSVSDTRPLATYRTKLEQIRDRLRKDGYQVDTVPYHQRSTPFVLTLDRQHADDIVSLCAILCAEHGIPKRVFVTDKPGAFVGTLPEGVIFHHQASAKGKWDCIPWLPVIEVAFAAAGFEVVP